MRNGIGFLLNRELSRAWMAWKEIAADVKAAKDAMRNGIGFLLNRELSRAFLTWSDLSEAMKAAKDAMRNGIGFLLNRELSKAFSSWVQTWEEMCDERDAALDAMRRCVSHLRNRDLSRGFTTWEQRVHELRLMRRSLSFIVQRQLTLGFATWRVATSVSRLRTMDEERMLRAVQLLVNKHLASAWLVWLKKWRGDAAMRKRAAIRRGVAGFLGVSVGSAMRKWAQHTRRLKARAKARAESQRQSAAEALNEILLLELANADAQLYVVDMLSGKSRELEQAALAARRIAAEVNFAAITAEEPPTDTKRRRSLTPVAAPPTPEPIPPKFDPRADRLARPTAASRAASKEGIDATERGASGRGTQRRSSITSPPVQQQVNRFPLRSSSKFREQQSLDSLLDEGANRQNST